MKAIASGIHRPLTALAGAVLGPAVLLAAAGAAWELLSLADFGYPLLYHWLAIDAHIEQYGPLNRFRDGFETLSPSAHKALFDQLLAAVNNGGAGLAALDYRPAGAARPVPLLRAPEIAHLELVAEWVSTLRRAALTGGVVAVAAVTGLARARRVPGANALAAALGLSVLAAAGLTAAAFDAEGWFARLHEWAFPPGHQWFFYYQESLMTMLLKAPDLFGPMAAALGGLTLTLTGAALALVRWALARLAAR